MRAFRLVASFQNTDGTSSHGNHHSHPDLRRGDTGGRVAVEHCIAGMKRYNALAGVYRNRLPRTDEQFNVLAAGLWNYSIN